MALFSRMAGKRRWQAKGDGTVWLVSFKYGASYNLRARSMPLGPASYSHGALVKQSSSPQGTMMILILGQGRVRTKGQTAGSKTAKVDGEGRAQGC